MNIDERKGMLDYPMGALQVKEAAGARGRGGGAQFVHGRSRMTIDPRGGERDFCEGGLFRGPLGAKPPTGRHVNPN